MTRAMEQSCVLEMTRGRLDIVVDAARRVHKDFGVEVSAQTTRRALCRWFRCIMKEEAASF